MTPKRNILHGLVGLALVATLSLSAACSQPVAEASVASTAAATGSGQTAAATVTTTAVGSAAATNVAAAMPLATAVPAAALASAPQEIDAWDAAEEVLITLEGDSAAVSGTGASVSGSTVTISAAGVYRLRGTLVDGQVLVAAGNDAGVILVLDNVEISNASGAPLAVESADHVTVYLWDGSRNMLADEATYTGQDADGEPDAALFSKDDLTIAGTGALTVTGNYGDGIKSKDDLEILGGTITVQAVSDGLQGRDSVVISGGTLDIAARGDGVVATNDEEAEQGYVAIHGGTLQITTADDGIQAVSGVAVTGGEVVVTAGGGSGAAQRDGASEDKPRGIVAAAIAIEGGTLTLDTADDGLHADQSISITGGALALASGDDAVHAEESISISGGDLTILRCYEGFEAAEIAISGGTVRLTASDDGINVVAPGASVAAMPGRGAMPGWGAADTAGRSLTISGGYIWVDAGGDGLDINGSVTMSGGTLLVNGPTSNANGALDYDGGFALTGGLLVAAGSVGMAQAPDTTSTQNVIMVTLPAAQQGGTLFSLLNAAGEALVTFAPTRAYQSIVISTPDILVGETYTVIAGGSSTGTAVDGLYTGGSHTGGSVVATVETTSVVTGAGAGGMFGAPGGMRPGRRP